MSPHRICGTSESEFSHPVLIPDVILEKLDEDSVSLRSYQQYVQGNYMSPKKKMKHLGHAAKKPTKEKKQSNSNHLPYIPSPYISEDNLGADLDETTSPHKSGTTSKPLPFLDSLFQAPFDYAESSSPAPVSPAFFQSDLKGPRNRVSLVDYDSNEDNEQEGEKQFEIEDLTKSSLVQDNQDEDTHMQTVDIPSRGGLIVDDEPNDMSIVLKSKASTRTLSIDLDDYSPSPQNDSQENDYTQ
ncbi:unnamed protein product [Lactuca virosa]|uniref:Protein WAVE n=1 Tax=Lactuca virosa TaxID=75947 RepID=A0AAU9LPN5_9ASTR|nr:unnamed protein product [Lactuca virosa]